MREIGNRPLFPHQHNTREKMSIHLQLVGLGEVLWDIFPDGPRFGGAPANFACSAAGIGGDRVKVSVISSVGLDDLGARALQELADRRVNTSHVSQQDKVTGQVIVSLNAKGSGSYRFLDDTAWDNIEWTESLSEAARAADAVCFGTLGQRAPASRKTIRNFVLATQPHCLRVLDINLRSPHWTPDVIRDSLPYSNVVKLNSDELPVLAGLLELSGGEPEMLRQLQQHFRLKLVALTRGDRGSILLDEHGHHSDLSGTPVKVADTVGAGDAFTAAVIIGMLQKRPLHETHRWADSVASFVCTQPGATPSFPAEFVIT